MGWKCEGWIDLVWVGDKWQDVVSVVMKLQVL
jgi:aminoglycoside phosphotransferase